MRKFSYEHELLVPVTTYLYNRGYQVFREIQIGFCRADIVAFTPLNKVIAVELKLSDWKKAIIQAKNYQLGSDFVYVVFPLERSFNVMKKASFQFEKEGIGLMVVHETTHRVCTLIEARESKRKFGSVSMHMIRKNKDKGRRGKPLMF